MPLVSVIMPVHNSSTTLGASVRSVLAQTHTDWELLITDDGSTDDSWEQVQAFADDDERVRPERMPTSGGAARARNAAIRRARGNYVAFLDSDDLWLEVKLERQVAFAATAATPLTFTSYYKVGGDWSGEAADFVPNDRVVWAPAQVDYRAMLLQDRIGALTAMYARDVLGTRLMPDLRKRQDYALWLDIMRGGVIAKSVREPLAIYRAGRAGSLSSNKVALIPHNWALYRRHEGLSVPRAAVALAGAAWHSVRTGRI
ncbi:glycosyltransferase family 2 protein [Pseudactinotalea sp. Z1748]|uniref:glycosyltransferase family 2 protein n=1 Tax=Pseudactinotalea sp. Z1748 TaxID=3413027 RepID=UPI003C7B6DEB